MNRLSVYSETAGAVGHETLPLGRTNFEKGLSTETYGCYSGNVPFPHRLVLPLLQNLHSRHSWGIFVS